VNERFAFDLGAVGLKIGETGADAPSPPLPATVAGADEAGRGCLAGPLVAAAVSFEYAAFDQEDYAALDALDDSKRLRPARRAALYAEVLCRARDVVVVVCSPATIDRDGLHRCNLAALAEALQRLASAPRLALVDGFSLPACPLPHSAVVGGDHRSAVIAAASVVAKVTRDRLMHALHARFPEYGFDRHVGYATAGHRAAIAAHGVCPQHRVSFASVAYQQLGLGTEAMSPPE